MDIYYIHLRHCVRYSSVTKMGRREECCIFLHGNTEVTKTKIIDSLKKKIKISISVNVSVIVSVTQPWTVDQHLPQLPTSTLFSIYSPPFILLILL